MRPELVVDASVAIKLFVEEELSDHAEAVFQRLDEEEPPRFYVPDLFFVECANILWKYVRRGGYTREEALRDIADLAVLPLQPVSTADLLPAALVLALDFGITAYDACYANLAGRLLCQLITADEKLLRKLDGRGIDVQWLGDVML